MEAMMEAYPERMEANQEEVQVMKDAYPEKIESIAEHYQ
jgi:hypothetical protein